MSRVNDKPVSGAQSDDAADGSRLGRFDAATLIAVERANGGEWAGLGQVIVTFKVVFGQIPAEDKLTESCQLLCDAGLIEYFDNGLTLTPVGRKLLRRAGSPSGAKRPQVVTELLEDLDDRDLAPQGSVPEPDRADVAAAIRGLTTEVVDGLERVQAMNATRQAPPMPLGNFGVRPEYVLPLVPPDDVPAEDDPSSQ